MGFLAQLLPGLRELRLPLAVGTLWAVAAALLSHLLPAPLLQQLAQASEPTRAIVDRLPGTVTLGLAGAAVYLVGVVMHEIGQVLVRVLAAASIPGALAFVVYLFVMFLATSSAIALAGILSLVFAGAYIIWRRETKEATREPVAPGTTSWFGTTGSVTQLALPFPDVRLAREPIPPFVDWFSDGIRTGVRDIRRKGPSMLLEASQELSAAWDPSRDQVNYFLQEEVDRYLAASPHLLRDLVEGLPKDSLREAAELMQLELQEIANAADLPGGILENWSDLANVLTTEKEGGLRVAVVEAVHKAAREEVRLRREFIRRFADTTSLRRDVRQRVERAQVRLRADHVPLYDEYDRLRAEGEFRVGVAVPAGASLLGAGVLVADAIPWLADHLYVTALPALIVTFLLLSAGTGKKNEASQLLFASVSQEVIVNRDIRELAPRDLRLKDSLKEPE